MADLLLELFSEEIPARMQAEAESLLLSKISGSLEKVGLPVTHCKLFSTPRRLAIWIKDLPLEQAATETELKGPKVGAPDAALQGFLKKSGLTQSDLSERDGVYFAVVKKEGRKTAEVLKTLIEETLASFPWPKSMRWGAGDTSWVRPLHSILCIFNGEIVPVTFAGIAAGNTTRGHRFLSPNIITMTDPAQYEAMLEKAHVIADRGKRKATIKAQAEKVALEHGLKLKNDEGLLEEVTGLVEYPVVLAGKIDAKFMDLPKEVLVSEMRAHQKYFALENKDASLSDTFIITANITTPDGGKAIIAGNERVLRARLSDGRFFWDQDRKKTLDVWAEGLKTVTYHAKLGTIADKVERIKALALQLAEYVAGADKKLVERAAMLCKADLVTGMVGEFPELQGVMGRYYAQHQDEKAEVSGAIRDHYKPQGPADSVPTEPVAICVALADKLDTLISMFVIGEKPTGSKDPFALRRAALGVIRIVLENQLDIPLTAFGIKDDLMSFFSDRLKVQLRELGIRHDVIDALNDNNISRLVRRAQLLQDFLNTDDGMNLLAAYKRAANILAIEEKKDKTTYTGQELNIDILKEPEEKNLAFFLSEQGKKIEELRLQEKFVEAMKLLAELRAPVDQFFENTMVNCEDKELRTNRLRLLSSIRNNIDFIANFSRIEGDVKEQKKAA